MKSIKESSIIVCSIVRDAEKGLRHNLSIINRILKNFADFRVFVYENDSKDKTKEILTSWHETDSERIHVSINQTDACKPIPTEKLSCNPFFSHKRIDKMAMLRNQYMEYIDQRGWKADYLMVVDLDVSDINYDGVMSSFNVSIEWDAITAFGYSLGPNLRKRFHDTYALTMYGEEHLPQTEEMINRFMSLYKVLKNNGSLMRVFSSFGGLAIYRFQAIEGLRYKAIDNDDPKVEVRCEHYSIYRGMAERGYGKVYINPLMTLKYQDLTWKIAVNSIKRKIKEYLIQCQKSIK